LHWLRDLRRWGEIIAHYLKPNGIFYIVEDHPFFRLFTKDENAQLKVANPYFFSAAPERVEMTALTPRITRVKRRASTSGITAWAKCSLC